MRKLTVNNVLKNITKIKNQVDEIVEREEREVQKLSTKLSESQTEKDRAANIAKNFSMLLGED